MDDSGSGGVDWATNCVLLVYRWIEGCGRLGVGLYCCAEVDAEVWVLDM